MTHLFDSIQIREALEELRGTPENLQLAVMKQMVLRTGGRWDLPHDTPGIYEPIIASINLHGVFAMSDDPNLLPRNWMIAAEAILDGLDEVESLNV